MFLVVVKTNLKWTCVGFCLPDLWHKEMSHSPQRITSIQISRKQNLRPWQTNRPRRPRNSSFVHDGRTWRKPWSLPGLKPKQHHPHTGWRNRSRNRQHRHQECRRPWRKNEMESENWVPSVVYRLCCGPWECLAIPLLMLQKWRR